MFRKYFSTNFSASLDLRLQRPSASDFVCGQLCKSDNNSGEGGALLLLNSGRVGTLSYSILYLKTSILLTVSIGSVFLPEGD
jgi:hypothetical protein